MELGDDAGALELIDPATGERVPLSRWAGRPLLLVMLRWLG